jgi:hypothetical protein
MLMVLVGCGPGPTPPPPGVAYVKVTPTPPSLADLTVTSAKMSLDHIVIVGNVPPPPNGGPMINLHLDALGQSQEAKIEMLPQGVYSRVQFGFDMVMMSGTWKGTPFTVMFSPPPRAMPPVDLRSANAQELGPAKDVTFAVGLDVGSWFANGLLDQATPSGGSITCDMTQNPDVTMQLGMRIHDSFSLP